MPRDSPADLPPRVQAIHDFLKRFKTQKEASAQLGVSESQISKAKQPDASDGRLAPVEAAIAQWKLDRLTKGNRRPEPWDAEHDPTTEIRETTNPYGQAGAFLVRLAHNGTPFLAYDMNAHAWVPVGPSPVADVGPVSSSDSVE